MTDVQDGYWGMIPIRQRIRGDRYLVQVHLAFVRGHLTCVGLDLRSIVVPSKPAEHGATAEESKKSRWPEDLGNGDWLEITSSVMRGLPTAEVIQKAVAEYRNYNEMFVDYAHLGLINPEAVEKARAHLDPAVIEGKPRRRGPRPQLDDNALSMVVAPAYRLGGRQPVQAVREALESTGTLRAPVSIDQARKAVVAARARGFIPPAKRSRKAHQEES